MERRLSERRSASDARFIALAGLLAAGAIGSGIFAEQAPAAATDRSTVFLIDTSSSMYGAPLAEAKRALLAGTSAVPSGARIGLRSFGGACEDGGLVRMPLGPFDQATFAAAVQSLSIGASGTPTPAALRAAAATLPARGDRTLILVSDGGSSCGNPCPVAKELAETLGSDFRVDTLGFRAPNSAETELACVARATGGSYVSMSDSAGLQKALAGSAAARVTELRVLPFKFRAAATGGSIGRVPRPAVEARVRYTISERVRVRFTIERAVAGHAVDGTCRRPAAATRSARRCTRYVRLPGSFGHDARQGTNGFRFTGRLRNKKLRPGLYKLVATATDASGVLARAKRVKFRIVPSSS